MNINDKDVLNDEDHSATENKTQVNAYKIEDEKEQDEKSLTNFLSSDSDINPVKEGTPSGGQNFGKNNLTPAGNDQNNPSQYAGNTNPYFDRKEPSEEHPEDSNFTAKEQDGGPDYDKAQPGFTVKDEVTKPEKLERGNDKNDRPHETEPYAEGTIDNDETNVPGVE